MKFILPQVRRELPLVLLVVACLGRQTKAQTVYTPYHFVTVAGTPGVSGQSDGAASAALFSSPAGLAVDGAGNVYVSDSNNDTIREIAASGVVATIVGAPGSAGNLDGVGAAARLHYPTGLAIGTGGTLCVADDLNYEVRVITPALAGAATTWTVTTLPNLAIAATESKSGDELIPEGLAADSIGNIFYTTLTTPKTGYAVNEFEATTGAAETIAGDLTGAGYRNGVGEDALFSGAFGIALDSNDNLYVADSGNDLIRLMTPTQGSLGVQWAVTTLGGQFHSPGSADGPAIIAQFYNPSGIAADGNGNVYVADTGNNTIREITSAGVVTTLGGVPGVAGSADGTGSAALFNAPAAIAVDSEGNIYVADTGNNTIRMGSPAVAPAFSLNASPSAITVAAGRTAVFNATAGGAPAPAYQWTFNGSATIPGAAVTTDPILMVTGTTAASAGAYTCTATNSAGSVSTSATLSINSSATVPGYLANLSGRGVVGSGLANGVFAGFGVTGTGSKQLLIRGMGPGLDTEFQLPGYLADPLLTLYNSSSVQINQNGPWGGTQVLINAENTLGAFTVPTNSLDAMLYLPISVGNYSAEVSGVNGSTGIALAEIYDADAAPPAARLNNISVRTPVGTGSDILFGGFVIGGSTGETVLIRAIGPSLYTVFNLGGYLAQPILTLYSGSNAIHSNTVWGGDPVLASVENTVGAYAIPTTSQDSLLLVTLPPGAYSAQIQGVNNTTGIATVEIYEVY